MPGRKASEAARRDQILAAAFSVAVRERLAGLRIRDVAREAGLSTGLVLFHFKTKGALVNALLEWLLESTPVLRPDATEGGRHAAAQSLWHLVRAEAQRLTSNRRRTELFFDFWVAGTRTAGLRAQMRRALTRYRKEFRTLATDLLDGTGRDARITADAIAAAAVSFVHGCAIQAVIDPKAFDLAATLGVINALAARVNSRHADSLSTRTKRAAQSRVPARRTRR